MNRGVEGCDARPCSNVDSWFVLVVIPGIVEGCVTAIGNVHFVGILFLDAGDLVWVAHQNSLPVILLYLVWIVHFVHTDYLPSVTFPQNRVKGTEEHFHMLLLWLQVPWHSLIPNRARHTNPLIDTTLKPLLRIVPIDTFLVLSFKEVLNGLGA